jgi:hypothetical protein
MRTTIILCALLLTLQTAWKKVGETSEARFYLRAERPQETDSKTLLAWRKTEFRADTKEGREGKANYAEQIDRLGKNGAAFAYTLTLSEYDCARGLLRTRRITDYDSSGRVLYDADEDNLKETDTGKWESPAPESVNEAIMRRVCLAPDHEN